MSWHAITLRLRLMKFETRSCCPRSCRSRTLVWQAEPNGLIWQPRTLRHETIHGAIETPSSDENEIMNKKEATCKKKNLFFFIDVLYSTCSVISVFRLLLQLEMVVTVSSVGGAAMACDAPTKVGDAPYFGEPDLLVIEAVDVVGDGAVAGVDAVLTMGCKVRWLLPCSSVGGLLMEPLILETRWWFEGWSGPLRWSSRDLRLLLASLGSPPGWLA